MNSITGLGKYLFAIPMGIFGLFHFLNTEALTGIAPGGAITVYITGICLVLFAVSVFIGKYDKLAAILLALFLVLAIVLIHISGVNSADPNVKQMSMTSLLKDISLAGAALMYAHSIARDSSFVG